MEENKKIKLLETLNANHSWPSVYMFKFIIPSDSSKIARLESIFNAETAEIRSRESSCRVYLFISSILDIYLLLALCTCTDTFLIY